MIRLPTFTLINGPTGAGKTTLQRLLVEQDPQICPKSFVEPIRRAFLATFHPEQVAFGRDLRDPAIKAEIVKGTNITVRTWMNEYGEWLRKSTHQFILADMAKAECETLFEFYPRFLFDDCKLPQEATVFTSSYESDDILLISLRREGTKWNFGKDLLPLRVTRNVISLDNNSLPEDMIKKLESFLGTRPSLLPEKERL